MSSPPLTFLAPALVLGKIPGPGDLVSLFLWFGLAAVAAVAGYCVVLAVRRWAQREEHAATFTFQDLREMRARGQISEQEFASMRAALLGQFERGDSDPPGTAPGDLPREDERP